MPKVLFDDVDSMPFCETAVLSVYSGWSPIEYGHQTFGLPIFSAPNFAGVKVTVWVLLAGTVTDWWTTIGAPPPGGVTVAATSPVCGVAALLVTSSLTVSEELDRSAALLWTTCALSPLSAPETCRVGGNWMPVSLSSGIWLQSTWSRVYILSGSFGYTLIAREFLPGLTSLVTSKVCPAKAPLTMSFVATRVPLTQTSPSPTMPGMVSFAVWPEAKSGVKSVRNHHGSENGFVVTGPTWLTNPKHLRMLSEKNTLGHLPFCSNALISVPGAPASSGLTGSQPAVE